MKTKFHSIVRLVQIAAITFGLCTTAVANAADKIRMGTRNTNLDVILIESGLAAKYNLEIEPIKVKTGVEMAEGLIGGGIDVGIVGGAPLVSALSKTDKIVVLGSAWTTDGGYAKVLVRKDSNFKSIDDLKGKKIANKIGSGSYRALGDWCKKNNCKISDFQILNTAPAAIVAALESGSVDDGIWFAPTTSVAVHKGVAKILMDFKGPNLGAASWSARKEYAAANKEKLSRFMAATVDAQELIRENPRKGAELLARGLKKLGRDLPVEVLEMGINDFNYVHGTLDGQLNDVFNAVFEGFKKQGKIKGEKPNFVAMMDDQYYSAGLKLRK